MCESDQAYIQELLARCGRLRGENAQREARERALSTQNAELRTENAALRFRLDESGRG